MLSLDIAFGGNTFCVKNPETVDIEQKLLTDELKRRFFDALESDELSADEVRPVVVVCFGTTSISGDSLGPIVGTLLKRKYNVPAFVYGDEDDPVHGKNMGDWLNFIRAAHSDAIFLAVDASLGQKDKVGQTVIRDDGVCPAAIKGKRTRFGDIGALAVVAENRGDALMQLMAVPLGFVRSLAERLAEIIANCLN